MGVSFGTSEQRGDVLVVGSRPDEWTLLGPADAVAAVVGGIDLSGFASTTDITHSRLMIRLTGDDAARAMEKACGIDLSDVMTPDGAAVGASVAKVTCDIVRDDVNGVRSYRFLADRSFGQYFWDALRDCAAEF
jgi:heterotetrameric sarcosine oxidase gamma subunit